MLEGSVVLDPARGPGCSPGTPAAIPTQSAVPLENPAPTNAPWANPVSAMAWNAGSPQTGLEIDEDSEMMGLGPPHDEINAALTEQFVPAVVECGGPTQYIKRLLYDAEKQSDFARWLWSGMGDGGMLQCLGRGGAQKRRVRRMGRRRRRRRRGGMLMGGRRRRRRMISCFPLHAAQQVT